MKALAEQIGDIDGVNIYGRVVGVRGLMVEVAGPIHAMSVGARLVIETGDAASAWARLLGRHWYFLDPPQHLFYFTGASLEQLLARAGFGAPPRRWRSGRWVSLANIAFKLVRLAPPSRLRSRVIDFARTRLGGKLYLRFGDTLLVAAARD